MCRTTSTLVAPEATMTQILRLQGAYFVLTGLWSLLHIRSFVWVTGPKTDLWLVKTVGVLVAVIGAVLLWATRSRDAGTGSSAAAPRAGGGAISPEACLLAAGSAAGLTAIECWYVAKRRISPMYLLDAIAEAGALSGMALMRRRDTRRAAELWG
jgi:hypothetical protein